MATCRWLSWCFEWKSIQMFRATELFRQSWNSTRDFQEHLTWIIRGHKYLVTRTHQSWYTSIKLHRGVGIIMASSLLFVRSTHILIHQNPEHKHSRTYGSKSSASCNSDITGKRDFLFPIATFDYFSLKLYETTHTQTKKERNRKYFELEFCCQWQHNLWTDFLFVESWTLFARPHIIFCSKWTTRRNVLKRNCQLEYLA